MFQETFGKSDGVKKMIEVLVHRLDEDSSESNEKVIEVVLSILGNCTCNNENCANQVRNEFHQKTKKKITLG